jgi:hypothetical protein
MKQRTHKAEALTMRRWYDYQQRAIRQRAHILRPEIKQISKAWRCFRGEAAPNQAVRKMPLCNRDWEQDSREDFGERPFPNCKMGTHGRAWEESAKMANATEGTHRSSAFSQRHHYGRI